MVVKFPVHLLHQTDMFTLIHQLSASSLLIFYVGSRSFIYANSITFENKIEEGTERVLRVRLEDRT